MAAVPYTRAFYSAYAEESRGSARVVVPQILGLLKVTSVVDVGCGIGTWLSEFAQVGIQDYLGIDGDHVSCAQLLIEPARFMAHDLRTPLAAGRTFDLAISLEVAEHLPAAHAADFVRSLTTLAPVIVFSAAIPYQGGDDHVNEQWPEYWAQLFRAVGYDAYDRVRDDLWDDERVAYYYAQNMLIYVDRRLADRFPTITAGGPARTPLARVHPRRWLEAHDVTRQRLPPLLRALPHLIGRAIGLRVARLTGIQ